MRQVGSYDLLERLGEGGMGEVWLARHKSLRRLVAVKLIRPHTLSSERGDDARRQFEREAHTTSALRSPHTVALFDFGTTESGELYYAMELLEGLSLAALVMEFGPVSPSRGVHLLSGICESLGEAHDRGLIHRDVKPGNVFTCVLGTKYDFVKVLDFGLARTLPLLSANASPAMTGTIAGSPAFMAPEAARGEFARSCDIYGLGCVAFWLLTGKFVFEAPTPIDVIMAHMQETPVPPSARGAKVPPEIDRLVLDCLEKDPKKRPQSVAEFAERLEAFPVEPRWTTALARRFFDEHRDAIARANPALERARKLGPDGEAGPNGDVGAISDLRARGEPDTNGEPDANGSERKSAAPSNQPNLGGRETSEAMRASIDRLQHHFTQSHIDVQELELRMLRVKKAKTADEMNKVFVDLPKVTGPLAKNVGASSKNVVDVASTDAPLVEPAVEVVPKRAMARHHGRSSAMVLHDARAAETNIVSVMSSNRREMALSDGEAATAVAVMGETTVVVDGALMGDGEAELECVAVLGSITVFVKPGVEVECAGMGILGSFERWGGERRTGKRPLLRVTGVAVLGSVRLVVGRGE